MSLGGPSARGHTLTCNRADAQNLSHNLATRKHMAVLQYGTLDGLYAVVSTQTQISSHGHLPRRLNLLVKVLPQPGTGQTKCASFLRRLALAACVAVVVTCCFSTWRIGGRRGTLVDGA